MTVKTKTSIDFLLRIGACAAGAALLPGCPNPNLYTVPRTLDPGQIQVQVAPEVVGLSVNYNDPTTTGTGTGTTTTTTQKNFSLAFPLTPTVGLRAGLADGIELGVRAPNLDSIAGDLKLRLVKGTIDVAVDPGLQTLPIFFSVKDSNGNETSVYVVYFHVPVLVGINLSKSTSIVLSPGFVYSLTSVGVNTSGSAFSAIAGVGGVLGRFGGGLNIRVSKKFSIQPEVNFMRAFDDTSALFWVAGLGFNLGAQPDYSDLDTDGTSAPPAAPAAPAAAPAAP
jgi:hypothetical protein